MNKRYGMSVNHSSMIYIAILALITLSGMASAVPVKMTGWSVLPDASKGQMIQSGGKNILRVTGTGSDDQRWSSPVLKLKPGGEYLLRFTSQSTAQGGNLPCGLAGVNRDFSPTLEPTINSFVFRLPTGVDKGSISLGQYWVNGTVDYSNVSLVPIQAINSKFENFTLGDGESVDSGQYLDIHNYGWQGSTIHRTLYQFLGAPSSNFNSNRWVIGPDSKVVYLYDMPFQMTYGQVRINCNYHTSGKVQVGVSVDGVNYTNIGELSSVTPGEFTIPASVFPTKKLYVMISAGSPDTSLQVDTYQFGAKTDYQGPPLNGRTLIVEEPTKNAGLDVKWSQGAVGLNVTWTNKTSTKLKASVITGMDGVSGKSSPIVIPAKGSGVSKVAFNRKLGTHILSVKLTSGDDLLYSGSTEMVTTVQQNDDYGYRLKSNVKDLDVWWCESNWKVGPSRPVPGTVSNKPVSLSAAKGEFEGVQLILNPRQYGTIITGATSTSLTNGTKSFDPSNIQIFEIATVPVKIPTDSWGEVGDYPDPLPALDGKLSVSRGRNQGLWVSVHVPENTESGTYTGKIQINTNKGDVIVPFEVVVYGFAIPKFATLRSALGLPADPMKTYNKLVYKEQELATWDKYMKNWAEHRISPYSFFPYAPIGFSIEGEPGNRKVKMDWTAFDKAAEQFLDKYNLSSFSMPINGLGGGTFYDRQTGELDGNKAGTPEYEKLMADYLGQVQSHLQEKGWLSKAYVYWFDEPDEKDYPFVVEVNQRLKKYAPGLKRLLTEQPEPPLYGNVDIWCGLTSNWSQKTIDERNAAGEEVWWYICCGPKAPYVGEFIDHPGTEMRLWIWQTWQHNVKGILIWTTNWWTSSTAFPDSLQNPWEDAMSYVDGYGTPKGAKLPWGNGDGRFLYPPRRDPNKATEPYMGDPISSVRWEALRDGMEDYEYFYMLKNLITEKSAKIPADLKTRAERLLIVPEAISKDMTHFTTDPRLMLEHRDKIARMIERLSKL